MDNEIKYQLAVTYRMLAYLGMDDLTYTHLSARSVQYPGCYYMHPLGQLFEEVTINDLLLVNVNGDVVQKGDNDDFPDYNKTGYVIHGSIYNHNKDVKSIMHLHTIAGVSVASTKQGLMSLSQFSMHFHNNIGRSDYDALALNPNQQGGKIVEDLQQFNALLLNNHGTLCCGKTIQEAFFYIYYLEQACRVQCQLMADLTQCIMVEQTVCQRAKNDMRAFEKNLGQRDWLALERVLQRKGYLNNLYDSNSLGGKYKKI